MAAASGSSRIIDGVPSSPPPSSPQALLEMLKFFTRSIGRAAPEIREGFVLAQVLALANRLAEASQAGDAELAAMCLNLTEGAFPCCAAFSPCPIRCVCVTHTRSCRGG